ncbi:MAG: alpha/beta fold hydrolase [Burkholderiales bacterium]
MAASSFPTGYHALHPDVDFNFQMNRWYNWIGEAAALEDMQRIAGRIRDLSDWTREFVALAAAARQQGRTLAAAFYERAANFYMLPGDPDRSRTRSAFLRDLAEVYGDALSDRHAVPYDDGRQRGVLPAYRLRHPSPASTVVVFGGFDTYIEELVRALLALRDAGYEVIAFDGPGQGGALLDSGLHLTPDWHRPVGAVLDHFGVADAVLVGVSLGGGLVLRAAAREPRISRLVAYDVLDDFYEVVTARAGPRQRGILRHLLTARLDPAVNGIVGRTARSDPSSLWGLQQGMEVTGTGSPAAFLRAARALNTFDVSASVSQDVLILAGAADHYVPVAQCWRQSAALTRARSVTARVFTAAEDAASHCQVGNYGLVLETILGWLEVLRTRAEAGPRA